MKIVIAVGATAFVVTFFWLMNLYRRTPKQDKSWATFQGSRISPLTTSGFGWRDLEGVDSV